MVNGCSFSLNGALGLKCILLVKPSVAHLLCLTQLLQSQGQELPFKCVRPVSFRHFRQQLFRIPGPLCKLAIELLTPTGCATGCTYQMKRLETMLCCMYSFCDGAELPRNHKPSKRER